MTFGGSMKKKNAIILGIVLAAVVLSLPNSFHVEKSTLIRNSAENVFSYLVNLESWPEWSPLNDGNVKFQFSGVQGVVGSALSWEGSDQKGQIILTALEQPNILETEVINKNHLSHLETIQLEVVGDGLKVVWTAQGTLPIFGNLMHPGYKRQLEKSLTLSLEALKASMDNQ